MGAGAEMNLLEAGGERPSDPPAHPKYTPQLQGPVPHFIPTGPCTAPALPALTARARARGGRPQGTQERGKSHPCPGIGRWAWSIREEESSQHRVLMGGDGERERGQGMGWLRGQARSHTCATPPGARVPRGTPGLEENPR